jgi:hypothetical protein
MERTNKEETSLTIIMLLFMTYLMSPLLFGGWLYLSQGNGSFPVERDSIGIPFAGFLLLWFILFPVVIIFLAVVEFFVQKTRRRG